MDDGMDVSSITTPLTVDPKASTSFFGPSGSGCSLPSYTDAHLPDIAPSSTGPVPMNVPATSADPQANMVERDQGLYNDEPGRKTM
ncbi:hypothetical protein QFC19_002582 [Naganishia cerealis]|uniref:Uncharacterized protein n=1 Tax=Naganishia cerealis TaxID=610337 RepID=A0ACC2WB80_9TREE|nr:hypothetical protein QFC19_002582 [Naganishia cerealis]